MCKCFGAGIGVKTILSFDGGGVRGVISIAFLQRIEELLKADAGIPLTQQIDLVGGTSTGAIIAGALALGHSSDDIRSFYHDLAPRIFKKSRMRIPGIQSVFDAAKLKEEIVEICGDRTLDSADLQTGFALVMKRVDTGSPWILSNNPKSAFWETPEDGSYLGNRHYRLSDLIRASTAAPHYFQPQPIQIVTNETPGLFVDGGVTPHNNPALAFLQMTTIPELGYGWPVGVDNMRIISVGTGSFRPRLDAKRANRMPAAGLAVRALAGMIADGQNQALLMMQALGRPAIRWHINSEIGDMTGYQLGDRPLFEFVRYDVMLDRQWLRETLGLNLTENQVERLRQMDNPDMISLAYEIGQAAAADMVKLEHLKTATPDG